MTGSGAEALRADGLTTRCRPRDAGDFAGLRGVCLALSRGEALGVVGRSGAGKSTLARALLGLVPLAGGRVWLEGRDFLAQKAAERRRARRNLQFVPQDPGAALDPRQRVASALAEPLLAHGLANPSQARAEASRWLARVGLPAAAGGRYPHQLSGGERQRVGVARALILAPRVVVADEPVSALDPALRGEVLDLLFEGVRDGGAALLLIAHELEVVLRRCQRIAVMAHGELIEEGPVAAVLSAPRRPEARALFEADRALDERYPSAGRPV